MARNNLLQDRRSLLDGPTYYLSLGNVCLVQNKKNKTSMILSNLQHKALVRAKGISLRKGILIEIGITALIYTPVLILIII